MQRFTLLFLLTIIFFSKPLIADSTSKTGWLSDPIINIGIKSKLSGHVLSNCRVDSSLRYSKSINDLSMGNVDIRGSVKLTGLRKSASGLPNSYRAAKMEFAEGTVKDLFGDNLKYTSKNDDIFPAKLLKDWSMQKNGRVIHYDVGMTLFSALPPGINAASIYSRGELNMSYRMDSDAGQLECDIYDLKGNLIGLVDYVTKSTNGVFGTLAYGKDSEERDKNNEILKTLKLQAEEVHDYHGDYPSKRIVLTISDQNISQAAAKLNAAKLISAANIKSETQQAIITNNTNNLVISDCHRHGVHGSWDSYPSASQTYAKDQHFTFSMTSGGHGIQGEIRCQIYYQLPDDDSQRYSVARLLVEINNDGTALGLFPYVNDEELSTKLVEGGYKYTIYAENDGNYSFNIYQ